MLKYAGYDIVFQEIPDEVTLALNLSGCPNGCPGCHSPHLQRDEGEALTPGALERLLERYGREITCVCFMGGDAAPGEVAALARHIARTTGGTIRTGWYSGRPALPPEFDPLAFDYVKLGPYREKLGGLNADDEPTAVPDRPDRQPIPTGTAPRTTVLRTAERPLAPPSPSSE